MYIVCIYSSMQVFIYRVFKNKILLVCWIIIRYCLLYLLDIVFIISKKTSMCLSKAYNLLNENSAILLRRCAFVFYSVGIVRLQLIAGKIEEQKRGEKFEEERCFFVSSCAEFRVLIRIDSFKIKFSVFFKILQFINYYLYDWREWEHAS